MIKKIHTIFGKIFGVVVPPYFRGSDYLKILFPLSFFIFLFVLCDVVSAASITKPANNLGLVGYWSFEDASGTKATDFSGYGNTGTLTNMANPPTATSGWGNGKLGKGLSFDGVNDYVTMGDVLDMRTNDQTVSVWIKTTDTDYTIMAKQIHNSYPSRWILYYYNGKLEVYTVGPNGALMIGYLASWTSNTINDGNWHHVAVVWDRDALMSLYVDGELKSSTSIAAFNGQDMNTVCPLYIGMRDNGLCSGMNSASAFSGKMDDIRMYYRALTQTEIRSLYNSSAQKIAGDPSGKNLAARWSFEDATSTTATDSSGNNNTATLNNMASPATATSGWGNGKVNQGLNFDGSNDYLTVADSDSLDLTGDFTIALWAKRRSGSVYDFILNKKTTYTAAGGWLVYANSGLYFDFIGQNGNYIRAPYSYDTNWHFYVIRKTSGVVSLYQDMVLKTSGAVSVTAGTDNLEINRRGEFNSFAGGSLDEVYIYNRSLSDTELQKMYSVTSAKVRKINSSQNTTSSSLDQGLVGLWSFNGADVSGTTAYDRSGNGNNGTLTNGPKPTIGKVGQALSFDESNDYINVPDSSSLQLTSQFTLSAWIYFTGTYSNINTVFMKNLNNTNYYGMYIGSGRAWFYNPSITMATNLFTIPSNEWKHVVITFDSSLASSNAKIYLDGSLDSSVTKTTPFTSNTGTFSIGRDPVNGRYFGGKIDEVRIYNRALSANEVKLLYNMGK